MFGKILSIEEDRVKIENLSKKIETTILNAHVIFEDGDKKIVGEILDMNDEAINIVLVGEFNNGEFSQGIIKKPSINSTIRMIYKDELEVLLGKQDVTDKEWCYVGK